MSEPRDLTRDEAAERGRLLDVERYDVEVDLTGLANGDTFESRTTIAFGCTEPGAASWVDLVAKRVRTVRLNGIDLDPAEVAADGRVRLPDLATRNELLVEATHRQSARNHGLRRSVDPVDGAAYAWTHFEPFHARWVFACFDQPDLKAPFRVQARVPEGWTCIGNGRVERVDGELWEFAETPPLATYVTALCAGPFCHVGAERDGVTLGVYARQSLRDRLERDADAVLDVAAGALAYFGDAYGVRYPSDKLDQVYLPDFPAAMENFGCITYADTSLFRAEPTPAQRQRRGQVQLHEIAHMWFGNLVTMPWWDGLWLKEAFATMAATLAAPSVLGDVDIWATFAAEGERRAYAADQSPATHPVQVPIPDIATAESVFDALTYSKGLAVLRQLVTFIGADAFQGGMRSYFARYAHGTADLAALLGELESASGHDLADWSDGWVHRTGSDTIALRTDGPGQPPRIEVTPPDGGHPRRHRLVVGHYRPGGDGRLRPVDRVEVDTGDGTADLTALGPVGGDDLLLLNDDDLTYAKLRLDERSLDVLLRLGHTLPTAVSRAVALHVVGDLLADGELPCRPAVAVATAALREEPDASMASAVLATARDLVRMFAPADQVPYLQAEIAAACLDALPRHDRAGRLAMSLGAAACATTADQLAAVDELLAADPQRHRDLRWTALTRKVAVGAAGIDAVEAQLRGDDDPAAAELAVLARAALGTPEAKRAAMSCLFDERAVPVTGLASFGDAMWQRHQEELLRPYASEFVDRIEDLRRERGTWTAGRAVAFAFPSAGVDAGVLDRADAMAAGAETPPNIAKNLRIQTYALRKALAGRAS